MRLNKPLCVGLSISVTWLTGQGWRSVGSRAEGLYSSDLYVDIAKKAEGAKLDFIFRPDAMSVVPEAVEKTPAFSSTDPMVLLASIARETDHIGLVSTASTTFFSPYIVARQFQSLNWVSNGRAGWNVVTSLEGHGNFGVGEMPGSSERYERAREFTEVVRQLWSSFPHDALLVDRETGAYANPDKIRPIRHTGPYFDVQGPLNVPAHSSGSIPLFQAGASDSGRDFAASVADAIFAATPDSGSGIELRQDLRRRAVAHGRRADDIRVLPGLCLYLGRTRNEARDLYLESFASQDMVRKYRLVHEMLGVDLSVLEPDRRLTIDMLPALDDQVRSQTHANLLRRAIERDRPTVRELMTRPEVAVSAHWLVIGTAEDAVREIIERTDVGAADGFIALPCGSPESLDLFLTELMPQLTERNLFRREYRGRTLRDHLDIRT